MEKNSHFFSPKNILRSSLLAIGAISGQVSCDVASRLNPPKAQEQASELFSSLDTSASMFLSEWLRINGNIRIVSEDRASWNARKWAFLQTDLNKRWHTLFLPSDLQAYEIVRIIRRIEWLKHWEAGFKSQQWRILLRTLQGYVATLQTQLSQTQDMKVKHKLQQAIGAISTMIQEEYSASAMWPEKDNGKISEKVLVDEISHQLLRSAFSHGVADVRDFMGVFTISDFQALPVNQQKTFIALKKSLATKQRLLREEIGISALKNQLIEARKTGNIKKIAIHEHRAIEKIHQSLARFPWAPVGDMFFKTSNATDIIATRRVTCVGQSLLAHGFLAELGIAHSHLSLYDGAQDAHSAIKLRLSDGGVYYFDGTNSKILPMRESPWAHNGAYHVDVEFQKQIGYHQYIEWDASQHIMAEILALKGLQLQRQCLFSQAVIWYEKSIQSAPYLPVVRSEYAETLRQLSRYAEACEQLKEAIKLDPANATYRARLAEFIRERRTKKDGH